MQLIEIINALITRLNKTGLDPEFVPGLVKTLSSILYTDSQQSLEQINTRLTYLGWVDTEVDYHTMQLAVACIEANGLDTLGKISATWSQNHRKAA